MQSIIGTKIESRNCGMMRAVSDPYPEGEKPRKQKIDVQFENGYVRNGVPYQNFLLGAVRDNTEWDNQRIYNTIFKTGRSGDVEITFIKDLKHIDVKFVDTGNIQVADFDNIIKGLIVDKKEQQDRISRDEAERKQRYDTLVAKQKENRIKREQEAQERKEQKAKRKQKEAERVQRLSDDLHRKAVENETNIVAVTTPVQVVLDQGRKLDGVLDIDFKDRDGNWVLRYRDPSNGKFIQTRLGKLHNNVTQRARNGGSFQDKFTPSYKGVTVSDEWKDAQKFCEWAVQQPGWGLGYHLDKDLLVRGNREYSAETCCFVPRCINSLIKPNSGSGKQSYIYKMADGKYQARLSADSKHMLIGVFSTFEEALAEYKSFKSAYARKLAEEYKSVISEAAYNALVNWEF